MIVVNDIVIKFQNFLLAGWEAFEVFNEYFSDDEKEEKVNDWLQANWELLVESTLCGVNEYLEVYGYGADCNGASSRITFPDKLATHRIVCNAQSGNLIRDVISGEMKKIQNMSFESFMKWDESYYQILPPFNHVLLSNDTENNLVNVKDVYFDIVRVQ